MAKESSPYIFHPYRVLLVLLLFGISMLFLSLSISLVYTRIQNNLKPIQLPLIFYFNTLLLLMSSYTLWRAKQNYLTDDTDHYIKSLIMTVVITLIFLISQFYGWKSMFNQNIFINSDNSASYLYVISGLHFAHVLGGLPFLILFITKAKKHMKEPVSVLVYFSDPEKRLKLRLLSLYWHYLDGLWIYLVLFFLINYIS
jgi:cytochrome c oxidase subunit 3